MIWVVGALSFWVLAWAVNARLAASELARLRAVRIFVPVLFGVTLLVVWEGLVRGLEVPLVILPPPTMIAERFGDALPILWADFVQTFVKGALSGYVIGCGAAFAVAILIDRSPFLQKGLLPVGNFIAALAGSPAALQARAPVPPTPPKA